MTTITKITERLIEDCRHRFEAGDKTALLDAIDFCGRSATVMPVWLAEAYCAAYTEWTTYKVRSLDQAFGVERKGRRIRDLQKGYASKAAVAIEVSKLHQEGVPIDEGLFEQVGEKLNIPTGQVRALYYESNSWRQFNEALNKLPPKPDGLEEDSD
jgi:hypothetical protein